MLKLFNRKKKDNKGFTLVELVVVIAILAILVGLLAPQYTKYVEKARKSSDASNLENMVRAVEVAIADPDDTKRVKEGTYTITIADTATTISDNTDGTTAADADSTVVKAVTEVVSGWATTGLKSKNWGTEKNTVTSISAKIVVNRDGSFTVEYNPAELQTMIGKSTTK